MYYILAVDQGTSSTRAMLYNTNGRIEKIVQKSVTQIYPKDGWVEHSPEDIWQKTLTAMKEVLQKSAISIDSVKACGITNQRETTVLWNKENGEVIGNAIVWQDRRTASYCKEMIKYESIIRKKTGLLLDPYFSATKIRWLLDNNERAQRLLQKGLLAFGTIDSFLMWRLSMGAAHVTDVTNASRTMLFNIDTGEWDEELLEIFDIPHSILPNVLSCNAHFTNVHRRHFGKTIPITGVAGDQHAATVGQACFSEGMMKVTYGTGAFLLLNTGKKRVHAEKGLLSTIAYQIDSEPVYGLEGSLFNAGMVMQWLRDALHLISDVNESAAMAADVPEESGVYLVPAFTGLGAPYWQANVKASLFGLQLDTDKRHIVKAALESVAYQTKDILLAMQVKGGSCPTELRVDGGMVVNEWLLQCIANICGVIVRKPRCIETTVRGVAWLAALGAGLHQSLHDLNDCWHEEAQYCANDEHSKNKRQYDRWLQAVKSCCNF